MSTIRPLRPTTRPAADEEDLHRRLELVVGDPDDVELLGLLAHHLLALDGLADRGELVPQAGGPLELELVGRLGHERLEPLHHGRGLAAEEREELVDEGAVLVVGDRLHARRHALLDVRVEARPAEPLVALELAVGARADRERAQQQVEGLADRVGVGVRTEVADALALLAAHDHGAWPLLVERHREERVRLVVLQPDVEPRPVLLDEVVLEEERLDLVADLDPLDGLRGLHHLARPRQQRVRRGEVVRQPAAQALRLADVDDAAVRVLELVRAGCVGDGAGGRPGDHGVSLPARRRGRCR